MQDVMSVSIGHNTDPNMGYESDIWKKMDTLLVVFHGTCNILGGGGVEGKEKKSSKNFWPAFSGTIKQKKRKRRIKAIEEDEEGKRKLTAVHVLDERKLGQQKNSWLLKNLHFWAFIKWGFGLFQKMMDFFKILKINKQDE